MGGWKEKNLPYVQNIFVLKLSSKIYMKTFLSDHRNIYCRVYTASTYIYTLIIINK